MENFNKNFLQIIALISVVLGFTFLFMLFKYEIPAGNRDMVNIIAGILIGSCVTSVYNYFFGSSKSSSDKTQMMVEMNKPTQMLTSEYVNIPVTEKVVATEQIEVKP